MIIPLMPKEPLFPAPELKHAVAATFAPVVQVERLISRTRPSSRWSRILRWLRNRLF